MSTDSAVGHSRPALPERAGRARLASHRGLPAPQSVSARHETHRALVGSQNGTGEAQSVLVLQPTQAPVPVSQSFASEGHEAGAAAHDA